METIEQKTKQPLTVKVDPTIKIAIENLARNDDRSVSNTIERILKTSSIVQEEVARLESAETAAV